MLTETLHGATKLESKGETTGNRTMKASKEDHLELTKRAFLFGHLIFSLNHVGSGQREIDFKQLYISEFILLLYII